MTSIELNGLWLSLGPGIQGKLHVFETSSNPEQLAVPLEERFAGTGSAGGLFFLPFLSNPLVQDKWN